MRRCLSLLFLLVVGTALQAADEPAGPSAERAPASAADIVQAATARAHASLYDKVAQLSLARDLTVGQFLQHMDARDEFVQELQRADQLGGPRWIDRNTCQVQLEITTARIAQALQRIAAARPQRSPLTAAQIARAVEQWPDRFICGTGSSAAPGALSELRPRPGSPWSAVSDAARRQTLLKANALAIQGLLDSISPVILSGRGTIGSALEDARVRRTLHEYLASRPLTRVDFRDDMQVEVALSIDERELFERIRSAVIANSSIPLPRTAGEWDRVWRDYTARLRPATARAALPAAPMTRAVDFHAPAAAPEWVEQPIEIQGVAPIIGSKLRSAVRAETDARAKLRQRVESLKLEEDLTVGEAARRYHRVGDMVYRFVRTARIYKTEYRADGNVVVYLAADPAELWDDLNR